MAITYHLTVNATTKIWSRTGEGIISWPSVLNYSPGGPYLVVPTIVPFDPEHETGGSFWVLKEGPHIGYLVSYWSNSLGYGDITITQSGAPDSYATGDMVVDPLAPWRLLIKGMGGATGAPGKNMLTFNAGTSIWSRTTGGIVKWPSVTTHPEGGPYAVNPIVVPFDPEHETGGSFWVLKEGPYRGYLVSFWSNSLDYGDISVEENEAFDRGPGEVLCTLGPGDIVPLPSTGAGDQPPHLLGASINYNFGGEMHFTLLVDSPFIDIPKPKRTHYVVEFFDFETATWNEPSGGFAGWVWDIDATDTEVVFYGIDYLAAFGTIIDERFNPLDEEAAAEVGSKYVTETIHNIVVSQLNYARNRQNSMVGFIALGNVANMPISISAIYSTFRNTLDFVVGLLNSHRAGTGKQTRVSVRKLAGVYTVMVEDDPGVDRADLPLRYGELVQGYRAIPFGLDWASRVNFVSRNKAGLKINYRTESSAINQAEWGSISGPPIFVDTEDANDARRRALQAAIDASRLGRQISVGLKLGSFRPGNGYDICDNLPLDINHGGVTTKDWGSDAFGDDAIDEVAGGADSSSVKAAYWTILGLTWETYDDGHWMTNFTLYPRGGGHVVADVCLNVTSEMDHWPLGEAGGRLNPSDGWSVYFRPGLALPLTHAAAVDFAGAWHFPVYGIGGEGTRDKMSSNVSGKLVIYTIGNGRVTIKTETASSVMELGYKLWHDNPGNVPPTEDLYVFDHPAGTDIVINVSTHDDGELGTTRCDHRIEVYIEKGTPNLTKLDYLGWHWEPGIFV